MNNIGQSEQFYLPPRLGLAQPQLVSIIRASMLLQATARPKKYVRSLTLHTFFKMHEFFLYVLNKASASNYLKHNYHFS